MLWHERRRYRAAVLALMFSGLLIITQLGVMVAIFDDVASIVRKSDADLWGTTPGIKSVESSRPMPARNAVYFWQHPAIEHVDAIFFSTNSWRKPDGTSVAVYVTGISTDSMSLGLTDIVSKELRNRLMEPNTVLIDQADVGKLGTDLGAYADIGSIRVKVVGTLSGLRSMGAAYAVMSLNTARRIEAENYPYEPFSTYLLASVDNETDVQPVLKQLQDRSPSGRFTVWDANELIDRSVTYWINTSGIGAAISFTGILALVIGLVITNQTLRGAVLASSKEFGTMRALGLSSWSFVSVIVEQSLWLGLGGVALTLVIGLGIAASARSFGVPMSLPMWSLVGTSAFILSTALLSGVMSARTAFRIEPAELLR